MSVVLHPRAVPAGRIQVWTGVFGASRAPALEWRLDGRPAAPEAVRPLAGARPEGLVEPGEERAFTGVFEFRDGVEPGSTHTVEVRTGEGERASLTVRSLPAAVPATFDDPFNVLLVSCFHAAEDRGGAAGTVVSQLKGALRPHLTLLMGDQVYLDLPVQANFPDDEAALARRFEEDYRQNWTGDVGYSQVLRMAPGVHLPDDHEYWNNFPHAAPHIQNTWREGGRGRWRRAALALYEAFQAPAPEGVRRAIELDVDPLSFFLLDSRTFRQEDKVRTLHPDVLAQFQAWAARAAREKKFPVVASGQSFLDEAAGRIGGAVGDRTMANYGDFREVVETLVGLADAGRPVLCLTGDVHWGRITETRDLFHNRARLVEVISSPTSLVTTIGGDQIKSLGARITGLFGAKEPWPRHAEPADPPELFAPDLFGKRIQPRKPLHRQRGNHFVLLSFRRTGTGLSLTARYQEINPLGRPPQIKVVTIPELKPAA